MAAMRRATAQADTFDVAVYSLEGEAQRAGRREICPLGVISLGSLHSFSARAKWHVTRTHARSKYWIRSSKPLLSVKDKKISH